MIAHVRMLTRIALFAALAYVVSWICSPLVNVSLIYFVVFSSGYMWGVVPGLLVGAVGMGFWTWLNPFGPAVWPVALAQVTGASFSGLAGAAYQRFGFLRDSRPVELASLAISGAVCALLFHLLVSAADAWVFQPFWPRFAAGLLFGQITVASNVVIFPLLFTLTRPLYDREHSQLWQTTHSP
jgi:uncharacterized membrane protein